MKIFPKKSFFKTLETPGDKSITHRAVMFSAVASGKSVIKNALISQDCLDTIECMRRLGAQISIENNTVTVNAATKLNDNTQLYCGNSGTTMRLLTGLLCGKGIKCTLTGDEHLSKRPMQRVADPLNEMGANITTFSGTSPINVMPSKIKPSKIVLQTASAQVKSAVILAALDANGQSEIIAKPSRNHSELMLQAMGANLKIDENSITVNGKSKLNALDITVAGDISSAAYFMVLGALLGEVTLKNVGINPTRDGILKVFDRCKVKYSLKNMRSHYGEKIADITVYKSQIMPTQITAQEIPYLIDEIPVIAVLLARASGTSEIFGAKELRVKECDRIFATAKFLNDLGAIVKTKEDGMIIKGVKNFTGGIVDSFYDHRIAMSGAVALAASKDGGSIISPECANISFPDFFNFLQDSYG